MGNEGSSTAKRRQQDGVASLERAKASSASNGTRPASSSAADGGGKVSKGFSFRRRTKSDAALNKPQHPQPTPQPPPPTVAPPEEVNVTIKIYRSLSSLDSKKAPIESLHDKVPEYKIHRRSNVDISALQSGGGGSGSTQSLPRPLSRRHRPRSTLSVAHDSSAAGGGSTVDGADYPELRTRHRSTTAGSEPSTPRTSQQQQGFARLSTLPKKVSLLMSDFPSTHETVRKLKLFEVNFTQALVTRYERLEPAQRLSILLLAMRFNKAGVELLSLWDYASRSDLHADIFGRPTDIGRFLPLVPDAILAQIVHVKANSTGQTSDKTSSGLENEDLWLSLARDAVVSVAEEASGEVARIYEYQIVLLGEDASNALAAAHAAECALNYVRERDFPLDRNTAVQGVVFGRAEYHAAAPTMFSVIIGDNELKWELHDLFQKPGLRKDDGLVRANRGQGSEGGFRFFASKQSDAQLYGYRGEIIDWDMGKNTYKLNASEGEQFFVEDGDDNGDGDIDGVDLARTAVRGDNFHRFYRPFRRLVGHELMTQYCNDALLSRMSGLTLRQYVLGPQDEAAEREDVQPVYRPLSKDRKNPLTFHRTRLDWSDMTRARFPKTDWEQISARGVALIHCDLGPSAVNVADPDRFEGVDLSYCRVTVKAEPSERALKRLRAICTTFDVLVDSDVINTFVTDDKGTLKTIFDAIDDKKVQLVAKQKENEKRAAADAIQAVAASATSATPGDGTKPAVKVKKRNTVTGAEVNKAASQTAPKELVNNGGMTEERKKKRNTAPPTASGDPLQSKASTLPANSATNGLSVTNGIAEPNQGPVHVNGESTPARKTTKTSKRNSTQSQPSTSSARQSKSSVTEQPQQQLETRPGSLSISSTASDDASFVASPTSSSGSRPPSASKPAKVNGNGSKSSSTLPATSPVQMIPPDVQLIEATPTKVATRASAAASPSSPTDQLPKTPNSALGDEVVTTFMSTPLDEANYGGGGSWSRLSQAAERNPAPPAPTVHASASLRTPQRPVTVALMQSESMRAPLRQQQPLTDAQLQQQQLQASRRATSPAGLQQQQQMALGQKALTGTEIDSLEPMLPDDTPRLVGRSADVEATNRLLTTSQRFVALVGQAGVGKSVIGQTAARLLQRRYLTPLYVDAHGALTTDGVYRRLMLAFGLRFQIFEVPLFITWLACRPQNLLLVLDNVDVTPDNDYSLSTLVDDLLIGVSKMRILTTCRRKFYDGPLACRWQTVSPLSHNDSYRLAKELSPKNVAFKKNDNDNGADEAHLKETKGVTDSLPSNDGEEPAAVLSPPTSQQQRLKERNIRDVVCLCRGNPAVCKLIMNSLKLPGVRPKLLAKLAEEASVQQSQNSDTPEEPATNDNDANDDKNTGDHQHVLLTLLLTINCLPQLHQRLLKYALKFATSFSGVEIRTLLTTALPLSVLSAEAKDEEEEEREGEDLVAIETALLDLCRLGYLTDRETCRATRYCLQAVVRLALETRPTSSPADSEGAEQQQQQLQDVATRYVTMFVDKLIDLKERFFSRDSVSAFVDFSEDMDSVNDFLLDIASGEVVYTAFRQAASLLYVVFFTTLLPEETYVRLYSRLAFEAERRGDVTTQAAALSCMAWYQLVNQQYVEARNNLKTAMDAQLRDSNRGSRRSLSSTSTQAFCQLCQARLLWIEQQEKAIELAREAVDELQAALGRTDMTTLIAGEIYDMMLIDRSSSVNRSMTSEMSEYPLEAALGPHPLLLRSYGSRRLLWDKFCLFQRACDMAAKAVDIARLFYADHPLTADALVLLASSHVKLGAIPQALDAAVGALSIRRRTLGTHDKTAAAYAMIARILRRACQYEDAVVFARQALDMYDKVDGGSNTSDSAKADVRVIINQCLSKQQRASPVPHSLTPTLLVTPTSPSSPSPITSPMDTSAPSPFAQLVPPINGGLSRANGGSHGGKSVSRAPVGNGIAVGPVGGEEIVTARRPVGEGTDARHKETVAGRREPVVTTV